MPLAPAGKVALKLFRNAMLGFCATCVRREYSPRCAPRCSEQRDLGENISANISGVRLHLQLDPSAQDDASDVADDDHVPRGRAAGHQHSSGTTTTERESRGECDAITTRQVIDKDGVKGLFGRGLGTRLMTNGVQVTSLLRKLRLITMPGRRWKSTKVELITMQTTADYSRRRCSPSYGS